MDTQPRRAASCLRWAPRVGAAALVLGALAGWVVPQQQSIVKALGLGRGPGTLPAMSGSAQVGDVVPTGKNTAYATLVGTMCRTAPADRGAAAEPECVANEDPAATNLPHFTLQLIDTPQSGWKVRFQPATSGVEQ